MRTSAKFWCRSKNSHFMHRRKSSYSWKTMLSSSLDFRCFSILKIIARTSSKCSLPNCSRTCSAVRMSRVSYASGPIERRVLLAAIYARQEASGCSTWPSPEQLKGRIILRVTRRRCTHVEKQSSCSLSSTFRDARRQRIISPWTSAPKMNPSIMTFPFVSKHSSIGEQRAIRM